MPGIKEVFRFKTLADDYERNSFDTTTFTEIVAVVGKTTWQVINAKKALEIEWEEITAKNVVVQGWGGKETVKIPAGLESSELHRTRMKEASGKPGNILRRDGNPEAAFKNAARILERTYTAPYLAHNCMEPVNCFAHVTEDMAEIYGPIQAPEFILQALSASLGMPRRILKLNLPEWVAVLTREPMDIIW